MDLRGGERLFVFLSDRIVLLQLPKTGSSHLQAVLNSVVDGVQWGKHEPLEVGQRELAETRLVLGSVRHPLDWYVSLWGYTCAGKGQIFDRTAGYAVRASLSLLLRHRQKGLGGLKNEMTRRRRYWRELYSSPESPAAFAEWYAALHSEAGCAAWINNLLDVPYDPSYGLYTHWLQRCYSMRRAGKPRPVDPRSLIIDRYIRLENQTDDLRSALSEAGYSDSVVNAANEEARVASRNASDRASTATYYSESLVKAVESRDRIVYEVGGY